MELIKGTFCVVFSLVLAARFSHAMATSKNSGNKYDLVVIGGGSAGLTAAKVSDAGCATSSLEYFACILEYVASNYSQRYCLP